MLREVIKWADGGLAVCKSSGVGGLHWQRGQKDQIDQWRYMCAGGPKKVTVLEG